MQDFKDLKVWQKAHALTIEVYRATQGFPRLEQFGLTAQIRRPPDPFHPISLRVAVGRANGSSRSFYRLPSDRRMNLSTNFYWRLLSNISSEASREI